MASTSAAEASAATAAPAAGARRWQQTAVAVEHAALPLTLLITDCPDARMLGEYAAMLRDHGVGAVLRICEPTAYDKTELEAAGVRVHELFFEDGTPPPPPVVSELRAVLSRELALQAGGGGRPAVAVHCVSGIGRAPVLVCCALIDCGLPPEDAVQLVRSKRRGAVNKAQLAWLLDDRKGFKRKHGAISAAQSSAGRGRGLPGNSSTASFDSTASAAGKSGKQGFFSKLFKKQSRDSIRD
ncbi:Protein tyrosine phosphatase type IVA 2 [Polyrhizophydium stewartii]|uniref:Protein tyrosine phosphatase type IVA 2 n=1 Tax=Polyrhizophydium stewartii TaxID=2732419 RepID=A0ABR4NGJ7_9FUNG|nr:Protein tyrosine phosphatase prl-1 [Polyrhizophydium stewartii]